MYRLKTPNFLSLIFFQLQQNLFLRVLGSKNKLATNICFVSLYSSSRNIFAIFNSSCTSSIVKSSVEIKCFINMHPFLYKKTLCLRSQRDDALIKLPLTFGTF